MGQFEIVVYQGQERWTVGYRMRGRMLRQHIEYPAAETYRYKDPDRLYGKSRRTDAQVAQMKEAEWRRRWRAAVLILKARLESVASGDADFEATFLGDILTPDGVRLVDALRPKLLVAYETGEMPPLLLEGK